MQSISSLRLQQHKDFQRSTKDRIPQLKEKLRNQYLQRTRSSRLKLLDKFRNCSSPEPSNGKVNGSAVDHHQLALTLMEEEWEGDMPLSHQLKYGSDEEQKALLAILEEVESEMKTFSDQLLEDVASFEEADTAQLVGRCSEHEVLCPVCQVTALHLNARLGSPDNSVSCSCGLRLPGVTLSCVQANIKSTLDIHGAECQHPLCFAATSASFAGERDMMNTTASPEFERVLSSNVLVTCAECEWMSFLL